MTLSPLIDPRDWLAREGCLESAELSTCLRQTGCSHKS